MLGIVAMAMACVACRVASQVVAGYVVVDLAYEVASLVNAGKCGRGLWSGWSSGCWEMWLWIQLVACGVTGLVVSGKCGYGHGLRSGQPGGH